MAVSYGFYNALEHDRLYDAIQMSSIFDGIIQDGVFSTIGDALLVTAPEDGLYVNVGPGRAWFNHTWTYNDTLYPIEAEEAEVVLDRIDAVILEVNAGPDVRRNSIYFLKGTPSSNPQKPVLTHNAEVNQYALAYVRVRAGQTTLFQSDIENVVGTDETPFVTGLMQQVSVERLLLQWNDDFYRYFANFQNISTAEFTTWMAAKVDEYNAWYADMEREGAEDLATFDTWFQHMKDQLDEDAAGHLQAEIDQLAEDCKKGSVLIVTTNETDLIGRTCAVSQGGESVTAIFDNNKVATFSTVPYVGDIDILATYGDQFAQGALNIPYFGKYSVDIEFWGATLEIETATNELYERPITVSRGGVIVGTTSFNASGRATYKVHEPGTYVLTSTTEDDTTYTASVVVTEETSYNVTLGIPTGSTVLPTDDIQTWLKCASIYNKNYGLIAEVIADPLIMERLFQDANACDYMVRSTSWAGQIAASSVAMEMIGQYSDCISKLVEDSTWLTAITGSMYIVQAFRNLVPVMTSNTTPSGVCGGDSKYSDARDYYHAFDNNNELPWIAGNTNAGHYVYYHFDTPQKIYATYLMVGSSMATTVNFKIQASNDGTNWTDISDVVSIASGFRGRKDVKSVSENAYSYYRIYFTTSCYTDSSKVISLKMLEFRGIKSSTDTIYSAANDTIYYYDENEVETVLATTDDNGVGTVDWSELTPGIYELYSSVAKDPTNISEPYTKKVHITKTTTEVYFMPELALYWYGFNIGNVNGYGVTNSGSGNTGKAPTITKNTNSIRGTQPRVSGYNSYGVLGSTDRFDLGEIDSISTIFRAGYAAGNQNYANNIPLMVYRYLENTASYTSPLDARQFERLIALTNTSITYTSPPGPKLGTAGLWRNDDDSDNVLTDINDAQQGLRLANFDSATLGYAEIDALWPKVSNFFSAANDTVYYLDNQNNHITFAKTDRCGGATIDYTAIPYGTYTLYSSVAKDPSDLTQPYSKQVTINQATKKVHFMPDGLVMYWYGYIGIGVTQNPTIASNYTNDGQAITAWDLNSATVTKVTTTNHSRTTAFNKSINFGNYAADKCISSDGLTTTSLAEVTDTGYVVITNTYGTSQGAISAFRKYKDISSNIDSSSNRINGFIAPNCGTTLYAYWLEEN